MRLGSTIAYEFLTVARDLARSLSGTTPVQNARRRRAISTAYYALFHAISSLCAETLAGDPRDDFIVDLLYRALGHAEVAKTLNSVEALRIAPNAKLVGEVFRNLQERRHAADYAASSYMVLPHEALDLVGLAATGFTHLEALDPVERLRLAVLLLAQSRPTQSRP